MSTRDEKLKYIRTLCRIFYSKASGFYKDPSIRLMIDKAKIELYLNGN